MQFKYSKLKLLYDLFRIIKYNFLIAILAIGIYFFEDAIWTKIVPIMYLIILLSFILSKLIFVFCTSFTFTASGMTEQMGLFNKTTRFIPYDKIQNIQSEAPFLMRIMRAKKIIFETGESFSDIHLKFIHPKQFRSILINFPPELQQQFNRSNPEQTLFSASFFDLFKASIGTFLFTLLFPIGLALLKSETLDFFTEPEVPLAAKIGVPFAIILIVFIYSILKVLLSYYHYEVSRDEKHLYIQKGLLSKKSFTIQIDKIQTIVYKQSWYQRLLGVTTLRLNSTGEIDDINEEEAINSLFPYLSMSKAQFLVQQFAPSYQLRAFTHEASPNALKTILFKPPIWALFIALIAFSFQLPYYYIGAGLLATLHYINHYLKIKSQRFTFADEFYQIKHGGFNKEIVVGKRAKVIDLEFKETLIDRKCNVLKAIITARSIPVTATEIIGITFENHLDIQNWFSQRREEIRYTTE